MKVLVTGGTGFVGTEIVHQLIRAQHNVHLLVRNPRSKHSRQLAPQHNVQVRTGNVLDPASLTTACSGIDTVIHLVGIISEIGNQTFENVHTRGAENIVQAAKSSGVKRFVHMSALGTRPNAASRYHKSKWAAEQIVRNSELNWTIFRPSIIYGPGDGFVNLFSKISRWSPVVPIFGSGQSKFQPVPVETVAAAFVRSITEPNALHQTFDLCGPNSLTLSQIIDTILHVTHRRRFILRVPLPLARLQAAVFEFLFPKILHKPPPLNRDQLIMLQEGSVGNCQPANDLFQLAPVPFVEGITKLLN